MASVFSCLQDEPVAICHVTGPFRACAACGGQQARINLRASGYHAAELVCCACGGHTSWLGRDHLTAMLAQKRAGSAA